MGIGNLTVGVRANTGNAIAGLKGVGSAARGMANAASQAGGPLGALTSKLTNFSIVGLTTGTITKGIARSISEMHAAFERVPAIAEKSARIGILPEKLGGLRVAARDSGTGINALESGIVRMVRSLASAQDSTTKQASALKQLGLSAEELLALRPDVALGRIADAMNRIPNAGNKLNISKDLFGGQGGAMQNVLAGGSAGLAASQEKAQFLGVALTSEQLASLKSVNDATADSKTAWEGVGNSLALVAAPAAKAWNEEMARNAVGLRYNIDRLGEWLGVVKPLNAAEAERLEKQRQAAAVAQEREAAEAKLTESYHQQLEKLQRLADVARNGENHAQYADDKKKFGEGRASILLDARERVDDAKDEADANKTLLALKRQIAEFDLTETQRKGKEFGRTAVTDQQLAEGKRLYAELDRLEKEKKQHELDRQTAEREKKALATIRSQAQDFGLSDLEKKRAEFLREVSDPHRRASGLAYFDQLRDAERREEMRKNAAKDQETIRSRPKNEALDARTAEGWAALRESARGGGPQQLIVKAGQATVAELQKLNAAIEQLDGGEEFDF